MVKSENIEYRLDHSDGKIWSFAELIEHCIDFNSTKFVGMWDILTKHWEQMSQIDIKDPRDRSVLQRRMDYIFKDKGKKDVPTVNIQDIVTLINNR